MGSWSNPFGPKVLTEWVNDKSGWRLNWPHYSEFTGLAERQRFAPLPDMAGLARAAASHMEDAKHHIDKVEEIMEERNRARDA